LNKVDILHFFNAVNYGNKPWLTTSEYVIPRYFSANASTTKKGLNTLLKPNFKKLISMSEAAHNHQLNFLKNNFPEYYDAVAEKMMVLLPSQKKLLNSIDEKTTNPNFLTFTIVASTSFFGKGGREILNAFDVLLQKKYTLKLNIISKFEYGDWASKTTKQDYEHALKIIEKYPENIKAYNYLENGKVLQMFKETDIGLLPTYADTFGYSVLESQANGCPVISTNVFAIPEINNNNLGWMIDVPKIENGNAKIQTEEERKFFSKTLQDGLIQHIENIYNNPQLVKQKAENCLLHIVQNHNPNHNATVIENIYDEIMSGKI
jgi:glycosyltransferase involved in cell wall biosynthesis